MPHQRIPIKKLTYFVDCDQENGPYLVGWDSNTEKTFLLPNRHSWNANHNMLYIDNPVGTGFSFTDDEDGFATTDEEVAEYLIEAMRQFMLVYPVSIH